LDINHNPFISKNNPVFYIAEIGGNHERDYEYVKRLSSLAITSGGDGVKFQF
jgi:N,N'-diacetyllegionaminate synthase